MSKLLLQPVLILCKHVQQQTFGYSLVRYVHVELGIQCIVELDRNFYTLSLSERADRGS